MEEQKKMKVCVRFVLIVMLPFLLYAGNAMAISLESMAGSIAFSKKVKTLKDLKFRDMVRQTTDYSCGAAALATILTYHFGKETSEEEIINHLLNNSDPERVAKVKEKGLSLLDLKNYAETSGFKSAGYRVKPQQLKTLNRPAVALINYNGYSHFVVIRGVVDSEVFLADPARGNLTMSLEEFSGIWNGILLVLKGAEGSKGNPGVLSVKSSGLQKKGLLANQINLGFVVRPSEFK
jgi:predicted double-glycine peptidase